MSMSSDFWAEKLDAQPQQALPKPSAPQRAADGNRDYLARARQMIGQPLQGVRADELHSIGEGVIHQPRRYDRSDLWATNAQRHDANDELSASSPQERALATRLAAQAGEFNENANIPQANAALVATLREAGAWNVTPQVPTRF